MNETEIVVMLRVLLSFVKDIHDGKDHPGPVAIRKRLRLYMKDTVTLLAGQSDGPTPLPKKP